MLWLLYFSSSSLCSYVENMLATVVKMRHAGGTIGFRCKFLGQKCCWCYIIFFLLLFQKYAGDCCENVTCGWHNRQVSLAISTISTIPHPPFTATTIKIAPPATPLYSNNPLLHCKVAKCHNVKSVIEHAVTPDKVIFLCKL